MVTTNGLTYLKDLNKELEKLPSVVNAKIVIDEDKIADRIADKMKRSMSGRTTEAFGGF